MQTRNHTDVLVIGGGVIGLACAHYLAQAGRRVRIVDQGPIGAGASHANCGLVFVSDLVPLCVPGAVGQEVLRWLRRTSALHIRPAFDIERLRWLLKFAGKCCSDHVARAIPARERLLHSSGVLFEELTRGGSLEAEYEKRGVLLAYRSEAAMLGYAKVNKLLKPYGLAAEAFVGKALGDLEPALRPDVYGAWYHRADRHLRPDKLLQTWKQSLLRSGVEIEEHCGVDAFCIEGSRIQAAVAGRKNFSAGHYVLAAGAWSATVAAQLGLKLPIQPGKGYSITMQRPAVCPRIPCYLYERRVVATPWPSGYRLGGIMEFSGFDTTLEGRRLRALKTAAGEYLREPLGFPLIEEWTGLRPMTYDDLPIIGRVPRLRNLVLATGHGMLGVSTAPATGKLVAEIVCGKKPHIDPAPFAVDRFGKNSR